MSNLLEIHQAMRYEMAQVSNCKLNHQYEIVNENKYTEKSISKITHIQHYITD